jgi:hypothetical protein
MGKEADDQLLLTEEQWNARSKAGTMAEVVAMVTGMEAVAMMHDPIRVNDGKKEVDGPPKKCCYQCGKPGHFTQECRAKKKMSQANLAQEEESALLLLERGEVYFEPAS